MTDTKQAGRVRRLTEPAVLNEHHHRSGDRVVIDGTLIVDIVGYIREQDAYVVETGHGSFIARAQRIVALA